LWNTIKQLNGKNTTSSSNIIISISGKPAITPQQKASSFNKQFFNTVLHKTTSPNRKIDKHTKQLHPASVLITPSQVQAVISTSNSNNTTGPDNINIRHLKHLAPLAIKYLSESFTGSQRHTTNMEAGKNYSNCKAKQRYKSRNLL